MLCWQPGDGETPSEDVCLGYCGLLNSRRAQGEVFPAEVDLDVQQCLRTCLIFPNLSAGALK